MKSKLREALNEYGTKQSWLVAKTGIHPAVLSRVVTGKSLPSLLNAYKIARALGKRVEDIWVWVIVWTCKACEYQFDPDTAEPIVPSDENILLKESDEDGVIKEAVVCPNCGRIVVDDR
ncbi:helix-turn-helix transcriptional regulator [Alicyclobacillus sp. ALC3]|nr:helix-turn-helix transcriptional regulator [Alicyclobacillus sp. ALC3]